ncbi:TIR domain-containing protein [Streptomyces sp. SS1-1]|uniref:toll/interleukin-1 receptor domain-containing protein n=1 Tax=Streptomyces sp. SS1-1 TaxID=2651869 RepID=UPI0012501182|nr:toll/interleukin-1 receptor domain-containing protein [Streptomyces sp. SS1-1]KAB2973189.1 TIR domain-containing protein [Streptomyces sp. SS1-1]
MSGVSATDRVFISYAHDDDKHVDHVRDFYHFLRGCGIDAELDLPAGERRQDWALWMLRGIRDSRRVIVVASPEYRRRSEGDAVAGQGAGVQWEARLLRDLVHEDPDAALEKIVPVVLPGGSATGLPRWLGGGTHSHYPVEAYTVEGAEVLLRLLTNQPYETVPALGSVPVLPPRPPGGTSASLVLPGPVTDPAPVDAPQPPPAAFVFPDPTQLLDALMACPALHRLGMRYELQELMGERLGIDGPYSVDESADPRTHLRTLVRRVRRTTLTADAVLKAMYFALEEIAPDDIGTHRVRNLLVASGLALREA